MRSQHNGFMAWWFKGSIAISVCNNSKLHSVKFRNMKAEVWYSYYESTLRNKFTEQMLEIFILFKHKSMIQNENRFAC